MRPLIEIAEEALSEFEDTLGYVSDYFRQKWGMDETFARLTKELEEHRAQGQ